MHSPVKGMIGTKYSILLSFYFLLLSLIDPHPSLPPKEEGAKICTFSVSDIFDAVLEDRFKYSGMCGGCLSGYRGYKGNKGVMYLLLLRITGF